MPIAVGIDLGTTNTVVAAVRDGVATTLVDPQGRRVLPSVVAFDAAGEVVVGHGAQERRLVDAASTVYSVKRLMGRSWDSPEVQQARKKLSFELREGATGGPVVAARGHVYSLPEISAFVLRQAKAIADFALGEPVERAVITVPASFNDLQRAATKTAGRIAGLEVLRILNEPTAAALAYGPGTKPEERIAVYDLGGGTFDVTVLDLAGNVFEVMSTAGDTALGGDDIDLVVAERMADDLLAKHRFDARALPAAFGRLRLLAEQMKRDLSLQEEQIVSVDDLVPGERGSHVTWRYRMTRPELEWASLALIERTFAVCQQAIDAAGLALPKLDRIILVGGATRMPMVARKVSQFFGRTPVVRINPDEVVALGAAIQASVLDKSQRRAGQPPPRHPTISIDSVIRSLSDFEVPGSDDDDSATHVGRLPPPDDFVVLPLVGSIDPKLERQTASHFLPGVANKPLVFDVPTADPGPPAAPRPRKAPVTQPLPSGPSGRVDRPATIPGALPSQPMRPRAHTMPFPYQAAPSPQEQPPAPLLIDVTPLSLSVETAGGYCDVLIEANTPVPCDRTRAFATANDSQTSVRVRVSQGPSKRFADNTCLGEIELSGIEPALRGAVQIAVTFEIDADGILNVRARDTRTGRETGARLQLVGE
jgi:molecular chaperone DnaK